MGQRRLRDISAREPLWLQLLAAAGSGVLPYLVRFSGIETVEGIRLLNQTCAFSLLASFLSVFAIRALPRYPGTESTSSILSAVSFIFGLLIAALLLGRIGYARGVLAGAYILCVVLLSATSILASTKTRYVVALLGDTDCGTIPRRDIDWVRVASPSDPLGNVHAVAVDLKAQIPPAWERRITELALEGVPVYHIKHLRESLTGQVEMEHISETSYGTLSPPLAYLAGKRAFDSLVAATLIVVLSPFLVAMAVLISLESAGPPIFHQVRMGFRGKPFVLLKFRTMRADDVAGSQLDAAKTDAEDVRITRLGRVLRRTRLDELPQLWNVLRGEMSLIGPRPEAAILSDWYEKEIPYYRYRHIVLPGVTGWAQVNQGHVTDVGDVSVKLNYDFYYIKHLSPWLDLLIIFKTIVTMCTGSGAR